MIRGMTAQRERTARVQRSYPWRAAVPIVGVRVRTPSPPLNGEARREKVSEELTSAN